MALIGAAVPGHIRRSGDGDKRQGLVRVCGPHKAPLCGQVLRLLGVVDGAVIGLEETHHSARCGTADKARFPFQHIHGLTGRRKAGDVVLGGIQLRPRHVRGLGLEGLCPRKPGIPHGGKYKLLVRHTSFTPSLIASASSA